MKDFLRSLLVPGKPPAAPIARPAAARPPRPAAPPEPPAAQPDLAGTLDRRSAASLLRDMMREKLKDPDYAKRFAEGLRRILRDGA